jgi:uncharacterized membrane-anchored protein
MPDTILEEDHPRIISEKKRGMKFKKIFSSETTEPISTKIF